MPVCVERGLTSAGGGWWTSAPVGAGLGYLDVTSNPFLVHSIKIKKTTSVVQAWIKQLHCKHDKIRLNYLLSASSKIPMDLLALLA